MRLNICAKFFLNENGLIILLVNRKIVVSNNNEAKKIFDILVKLSQAASHEELYREIYNSSEKEVKVALDSLFEKGVLISSENQYLENKDINNATLNPSSFLFPFDEDVLRKRFQKRMASLDRDTCILSKEFEYLGDRKTFRSASGQMLDREMVVNILDCGYGTIRVDTSVHKTVPSAGGLYPLKIMYLDLQTFRLYAYASGKLESAPSFFDEESVEYIFSNARNIKWCEWAGVVFVFANILEPSFKYQLKGLKFIYLEAGHVMQNINHYCTRNNMALMEIGALLEEPLNKLTGCEDDDLIYVCAALVGQK